MFLEANGGWIVPWLERLDHHYHEFGFDVPWLDEEPSAYFRRQCWISFDPDESTLAFTANSPLVGADRIVWASDYPHPDAKYPGTTRELDEATETLDEEARRHDRRPEHPRALRHRGPVSPACQRSPRRRSCGNGNASRSRVSPVRPSEW